MAKIAAVNERKAALLYQTIDQSGGFYQNPIAPEARSRMNVIFSTGNPELDARFIQEAALNGMQSLAGYKTIGGMRASIYNACRSQAWKRWRALCVNFSARMGNDSFQAAA